MIEVAASATYEVFIDWGITGATLGVRVDDNAGNTTTARTTGFTERPAGSGLYYLGGLTAPGTAGQYTLIYDDDAGTYGLGHVATEDLVVTSTSTTSVGGSGNLYVTSSEIKAALNITVTTYDTRIGNIAIAVSRAIDQIQKTRYYETSETRYYTPRGPYKDLEIDDLTSLSSVTLDMAGTGTYSTTLTNGTHFSLEPINNPLEGKPYRTISLKPQSGQWFPCYQNSVKVVGSFGWSAIPSTINQAALLLAVRLFQRKDAPFGALAVGGLDGSAVIRIARADPDVMFLLENTDRRQPRLLA